MLLPMSVELLVLLPNTDEAMAAGCWLERSPWAVDRIDTAVDER